MFPFLLIVYNGQSLLLHDYPMWSKLIGMLRLSIPLPKTQLNQTNLWNEVCSLFTALRSYNGTDKLNPSLSNF